LFYNYQIFTWAESEFWEWRDRTPMMNLSARNVLKGRVKQVDYGTVNMEITIELPGGTEA
jgi:hypothetical protein